MNVILNIDHTVSKEEIENWIDEVLIPQNPCVWGHEFEIHHCGNCNKSEIENLKKQIEKMKCGGNCKHEYWINTGGCYDQKCRFTGLDCNNCKDKWELAEEKELEEESKRECKHEWHDLRKNPNDLPKHSGLYCTQCGEVREFDKEELSWFTVHFDPCKNCTEDTYAWCEIPKFEETY